MSFLTPLYLLAGLGIALPILFHMIRRQPKGQVRFSSLMFLSPSPPRLVRRSKIDDLLLLILRGAVLALLAWAFARPFLRNKDETGNSLPARYRVILLDTSASMRRENLWPQALDHVEKIVGQSGPADVTALYTFDDRVTPVLSLDSVLQMPVDQRATQLNSAITGLKPSWLSTNLGNALTTVADVVAASDSSSDEEIPTRIEILLVSDLQSGADLQQLERFQWPKNVTVDLRSVTVENVSNAHFQSVTKPPSEQATQTGNRVLVANEQQSTKDQMVLEWRDGKDQSLSPPVSVNVIPGQSKTVRIAPQPMNATQLVLVGDEQSFDNRQFIAATKPRQQQLIFVGDQQQAEPTARPSYFLEKLPLDNDRRKVTFANRSVTDKTAWPSQVEAPLIVVSDKGLDDIEGLGQAIAQGTHVLWVLDRPISSDGDGSLITEKIGKLAGAGLISIEEAQVKDYSMLSRVDFAHPLFVELADPKYNDFTKVRFWRHRKVTLSDSNMWRNLASFDDDSSALLECSVGQGKFWLLSAGWQPEESQFAMSSKFIPIMIGMFELADPDEPWRESVVCGSEITLPGNAIVKPIVTAGDDTESSEVVDGKFRTTTPGLFEFTSTAGSGQFAVNLNPKESDTQPLDVSRIEQLGVSLTKSVAHTDLEKQQRQKQVAELENSQQLWRWLIFATLLFLLGETILAARQSRVAMAA
jgi:Aerotolerance regulator N-terminal/von Willebrand factor type A domain